MHLSLPCPQGVLKPTTTQSTSLREAVSLWPETLRKTHHRTADGLIPGASLLACEKYSSGKINV